MGNATPAASRTTPSGSTLNVFRASTILGSREIAEGASARALAIKERWATSGDTHTARLAAASSSFERPWVAIRPRRASGMTF